MDAEKTWEVFNSLLQSTWSLCWGMNMTEKERELKTVLQEIGLLGLEISCSHFTA